MGEKNEGYAFTGIIATTHLNLRGKRFTIDDLKAMKEKMDAKPFLHDEHNISLPPIAKITSSGIRKRSDGEWELYITGETHDKELCARMERASKGEETLGFSPAFLSNEDSSAERHIQVYLDKEFSEHEYLNLKNKFKLDDVSFGRYEKFSLAIACPEIQVQLCGAIVPIIYAGGGVLLIMTKPILEEAGKDIHRVLKEIVKTKGKITLNWSLKTKRGNVIVIHKDFRDENIASELEKFGEGINVPLSKLPSEYVKEFENLTLERTGDEYVPKFLSTKTHVFVFENGRWKQKM